MPTYYYVNTTKCVKTMLLNNKNEIINEENEEIMYTDMFNSYIEGTCPVHITTNIDIDEKNKCQINNLGECNDVNKIISIRINHILQHCIDINSIKLINILIKLCNNLKYKYKIDLNINRGNEYEFASLIIDNIHEHKWTVENAMDMITLLNNLAKDFDQNIIEQMNFASRRIMSQKLLLDISDRIKLIDHIAQYNISLQYLYQYSFNFVACTSTEEYFPIIEHLVDNYYNRIDLKWTKSALESAKNFDNHKSYIFAKSHGLINAFRNK